MPHKQPAAEIKKRILLADDVPLNLLILRSYLEEDGHVVVEANDGEQALERLQQGAFDAVFLDLDMPKLSGMEVMCSYRRRSSYPAPVFLITLEVDEELRRAAFEHGASGIIERPVTMESLRQALSSPSADAR